jgi:hypothetical protein
MALCQEALKLAYLNGGRMGLIGAPTYPMLRDATQAALTAVLSENEIPYEFNKSDNVLTLADTGSRIVFRPLDDFERLRGSNLAWFGADELTYTSEAAWLRLEGRLRDPKARRLCGFAVWTPKGFDWVYRRFIANPVEGYEVTMARPFENRFLLNAVPDYYERLRRSYDAEFYEQEVLGSYVAYREGLAYRSFQRMLQVKNAVWEPAQTLYWTLDFNVNPLSSLVAQESQGEVRVLDEIVLSRASTRQACEEFERRFGGRRANLVICGDASARRLQTTGLSDLEMIEAFYARGTRGRVEIRIPPANPPVRERVALVNAKLRSAEGWTWLWISPKCRELIADFEEVAWHPDRNEIDKSRNPKRSHLSDALGYLLWQLENPQRKIGEQGRRLL